MIKKIIFLVFVVFTVSFGQINDTGNLLKENDRKTIEEKISEIEKNSNIVYYINLGRKMDEKDITEKSIILDIIPDGKADVNVKLKFTQDIDTDLYADEIDNLLIQGEDHIGKKEYGAFIMEVLDISGKIVTNIKEDKKSSETNESNTPEKTSKFGSIIVLVLVFIAIFATLLFMKLKGIKKKK